MKDLWMWLVSGSKWMLTFASVSLALKICGCLAKKRKEVEEQEDHEDDKQLLQQEITDGEIYPFVASLQEVSKKETLETKLDKLTVEMEKLRNHLEKIRDGAKWRLENEKWDSIEHDGKTKITNWRFWNQCEELMTLPIPYQTDQKNPLETWEKPWYQANLIRGERSLQDPLYPDTSSILFATESPKDCTASKFGIILWRLSFLTKRPLKLAVIRAAEKYARLTMYGISAVSGEGDQKVFIQFTRCPQESEEDPQPEMRLLILNTERDEYREIYMESPAEGATWAEESMCSDQDEEKWFGLPDKFGKMYFVFQIQYDETEYGKFQDKIIVKRYEPMSESHNYWKCSNTSKFEFTPKDKWKGFHECTKGPFRVGQYIVFIENRDPEMRGNQGCNGSDRECDFVLSGSWSSISCLAYDTSNDTWRKSNIKALCREKIFYDQPDWEELARQLYKSYEATSSTSWYPEFKLFSLCRFLRTRNYFMLAVEDPDPEVMGLYIIRATPKTRLTKEVEKIIHDNPGITQMSKAELQPLGLPPSLPELLADENRRDRPGYFPLEIDLSDFAFKKFYNE